MFVLSRCPRAASAPSKSGQRTTSTSTVARSNKKQLKPTTVVAQLVRPSRVCGSIKRHSNPFRVISIMVEPATASSALFVFAYTRHQLQRVVLVVVVLVVLCLLLKLQLPLPLPTDLNSNLRGTTESRLDTAPLLSEHSAHLSGMAVIALSADRIMGSRLIHDPALWTLLRLCCHSFHIPFPWTFHGWCPFWGLAVPTGEEALGLPL